MGTRSALGAKFKTKIGLGEHPPGSNHNEITVWYGFDGAWCDMFQSWGAYFTDNLAAFGGKFAYTVSHANWFKAHGEWTYGTSGIHYGAVVFFQWEGGSKSISKIDHVGWVYYVHGGVIYTIEGNRGDVVKYCSYPMGSSVITGYGSPKYGSGGSGGGGSTTPVVLQSGSSGSAVRQLQQNLIKLGYSVGNAGADGDFGANTTAAVKKFQSDHHLTVDGQVGPKTQSAIVDALKNQNEGPAGGEEMPIPSHVALTGKPIKLVRNEWTTVAFDTEYSDPGHLHADPGKSKTPYPSIFTGQGWFDLSCTLKIQGLAAGTEAQVRVIRMAQDKDKKWHEDNSPYPDEFLGSGGFTFKQTNAKGYADAGKHVWIQVTYFGDTDQDAEIVGADSYTYGWK